MTTIPEMKAKVAKLPVNLDRMDGIVNGPATGAASEVDVDSGKVKTLARLAAEAAASAGTRANIDGSNVEPYAEDWRSALGVIAEDDPRVGATLLKAASRESLVSFSGTPEGEVRYLQEPGREGIFAWVVGDLTAQVESDPGEGIYVASSTISPEAGAWVRQFNGSANVRWWGADPTGLTDSTVAFRNACAAFMDVCFTGTFKISGQIDRPTGSNLTGCGITNSVLVTYGAFDLFTFAGSYNRTGGFKIDGFNRTSGYEVVQDVTGGNIREHYFFNIETDFSKGWRKDTGPDGSITVATYHYNVKCLRHCGHGYWLRHSYAFDYIDDECLIEFLNGDYGDYDAFNYDAGGIGLAAAGGLLLGLHVGGSRSYGTTGTGQRGIIIKNAAAVWLKGRVDAVGGDGVILENCTNFYYAGFQSQLNGGHQIHEINCAFGYAEGRLHLRGCKDLPGAVAGKYGLLVSGGALREYDSIVCSEATSDNIHVDGNAAGIGIGRLVSIMCGGRPLYCAGGDVVHVGYMRDYMNAITAPLLNVATHVIDTRISGVPATRTNNLVGPML